MRASIGEPKTNEGNVKMSTETHNIRDRAMIVRFSAGCYSAKKIDKSESRRAARDNGASDGWVKAHKLLVAPETLDTIKEVIQAARDYHNRITAPWDDNAGRLCLSTAFPEYRAEMARREMDYQSAVNTFCARYSDYVDDARRELGSLFDPGDYLDSYRLREKFTWKITVEPVPAAEDFRIDFPAEVLREEMQKLDRAVADRVEDSMRAVCGDVESALTRLVESMERFNPEGKGKDRGTFRDSVIGNLIEIADTLPYRNVAGNEALSRAAEMIKRDLAPINPSSLRESTAARNDAAEKARAILRTMQGYTGQAAPAGVAV